MLASSITWYIPQPQSNADIYRLLQVYKEWSQCVAKASLEACWDRGGGPARCCEEYTQVKECAYHQMPAWKTPHVWPLASLSSCSSSGSRYTSMHMLLLGLKTALGWIARQAKDCSGWPALKAGWLAPMNFCNCRQLSLACTEGYQDFGCWSYMLANTSRGLGAQLMSDIQTVSTLWFIDRMLGCLSNTGRRPLSFTFTEWSRGLGRG